MKINIEQYPVYIPPVNDATKRWGVYAIPRMWREKNGELVVRFNGEADTAFVDDMQAAPNLYFVSDDEGATWKQIQNGCEKYPIDILTGIGSPYIKLNDGTTLCYRAKKTQPIINTTPVKTVMHPNGEAVLNCYRYGDIAQNAKGIERLLYDENMKLISIDDVIMDFDEREIHVNSEAKDDDGNYHKVDEYIKPFIFKNPYFTEVIQLDDNSLVAICYGQHPKVCDRYCPEVYMVRSTDGGITWKKYSTVASSKDIKYGYSGDGNEMTLAKLNNGDLICAMRMDMSIHPDVEKPICGTMLAHSKDSGKSWDTPYQVSDESVTPHIIALKCGVTVVIYGRPGVHFKYSVDYGKTWSKPISIIGKTLKEERLDLRGDFDSKYADTVSYSNTFVEITGDNSLLVLYNNVKYVGDDGLYHKAAFVKKITFDN